jgi:hypothetical protein
MEHVPPFAAPDINPMHLFCNTLLMSFRATSITDHLDIESIMFLSERLLQLLCGIEHGYSVK